MAAALGSAHLSGASASAKSPRGAPDSRPQPSGGFHPPPPKKIRVEERRVKPKKVIGDGGVGGTGSGKHKVLQPAKSCGSGAGSWSSSPGKTSSSSSPSVAPCSAHKLFKQSHFFLHNAPPSSSKSRNKERQRGKVQGDGEERKVAGTSVGSSKCENGEVTARPAGRRPSWLCCLQSCCCWCFHVDLSAPPTPTLAPRLDDTKRGPGSCSEAFSTDLVGAAMAARVTHVTLEVHNSRATWLLRRNEIKNHPNPPGIR